MSAKAALLTILRLIVGGIFALTGFSKILFIHDFISDVYGFQLLPSSLLLPVAIGIVTVETTFGIALILGLFTRAAAVGLSTLTAVFAIAMGINLARGIVVDCGCFGFLRGDVISMKLLFRNTVIFGMTIILASRRFHPWSLDSVLARDSLD